MRIIVKTLIVLLCGLFYGTSVKANIAENQNIKSYASSDEWLKLLHYKKGTFSGYTGLVASDEFYVATNGRDNPEAEMEAEIKAFNGNENAQCDFPARFNWLKDKGLVHGSLENCEEYQSFIKDVRPDGITILFTNAYMSNPASMFGHTLIRLDTARKGTQMLAHGSNFGADSGADQGVGFALKGLLGFYWGKYNLSPYWTIINTYNNIENRDIWEYHLNLTDEEQERFVNHLYEMKNASVRYFFLSKNCSYMLLELLEAVRPSLTLAKGYNYWAIPLDTLKTIKNVPDLIDDVHYRPARYTKIKAMLDNMSSEQYKAFLNAIDEQNYEMAGLSTEEQAEVLETVYQYYQYQYVAQKLELKEYRKNSFAVLRKRSQLPTVEERQIDGQDPSLSHDSAQISVSSGVSAHQSFEELMIRPAYTTLTDDSWGLVQGAGIKVFESRWRYYNQKHKFVLQEFTPLHIDSFVPATRVFNPFSYITDTGIRREYSAKKQKEGYVADIHFGVGKTYALPLDLRVYAVLNAGGQYGGFLNSNHRLDIAPECGVFAEWGKVRIYAAARKAWATDQDGDRLSYKAIAAYGLTRNLTLEAEYTATRYHGGYNREEYMVGLRQAF
ncbi:MAG: DUF4105 domain-containing protein [Alphaproteobacteria bacterium]|nr:DUF4105 domain-containing protein [Alphaproteobacteria bacterium]